MFKSSVIKSASFVLLLWVSLFQSQFFVGNNVNAKDYAKIENGIYTLISALDNNKVVDISGASSENGADVQLYEKNKSLAQLFYVIKNNDGSYKIEAMCSGKVLDAQYGSKEPGTKVWQYESNNTEAQKWHFESAGNGYYYIVSKLSGQNLDVAYGKTENGTQLWTYTPNITDAQKFKFEKSDIMKEIEKLVDASSCFEGVDNMVRKSRNGRINDLVEWYRQYGVINKRYNDWGLDIKDFRNQNDFLDAETLANERYNIYGNNIDPRKHRCYGDKFEFYKIMKKAKLENKTPKIHYIVDKGKTVYPANDQKISMSVALKSLKNGKYICKPQDGMMGTGVHLIEKEGNKISFHRKDFSKMNLDEFLKSIHDGRYIIQEYVQQHEKLSELSPYSLNTTRIITTRFNNAVHVLGAFLRMGVKKSIVDNVSAGGTCAGINLENGTLKKYGCYYSKFNKKAEFEHPVSHVKYEGYQLPHWKELLKLVKDAHKIFHGLSTIGWDVAITEKGPVIVELNVEWALPGLQATNGGLKEKWYKLKKV